MGTKHLSDTVSYIDNVFLYYQLREVSRKLQFKELRLFKDATNTPGRHEAFFKMWFPNPNVSIVMRALLSATS